MKQSRKEFIKKSHSAACSEWKTNIEKEFPKLFKEVANGWYKDKKNDWCMFIENGTVKYGFDTDGVWKEDLSFNYKIRKGDYKATEKEVEEALIKEAKKRGFVKGVNISYLICTRNSFGFDGTFSIYNDSLVDNRHAVIFSEGKWATIVETITKEQAEKELGKTILN